ncbi:hypothetical protein [Salinirubrum litoreum]|uniref:Uncharacterized protein n=1 Tax=Salinirubrum litoreum TaxID=1126234 RepID=A0ABD5RDL6_9EURY|nr:hypothetical protein [Salinirubrum litoreum]
MQLPDPTEFREVRRGLPVVAGVLLVVALALPMWTIYVSAVQYPDTTLTVNLYAYPRLTGDYAEMARLNKYVGFYYPDPVLVEPNFPVKDAAIDVPEWSLGPVAFLGVAATSLFVALAPTGRKLRRGLQAQVVGTAAVFGVLLADIQYRLWQAGHSLDPDAPMLGVSGFTPPLWGKYTVANITSYSRFGAGAYLTAVAVGSLAVAYYYRGEAVRFADLPGRLRERLAGLRGRAGQRGENTDRSTGG